jgi:hypothetical protein
VAYPLRFFLQRVGHSGQVAQRRVGHRFSPGFDEFLWYNCYTSCDSTSMSERAAPFAAIQNVESVLRRYGRYFFILTTPISGPIFLHRAIGWVGGRLYSVIFEIREDAEGEFYHLVTLWKATPAERRLYEENAC